MLFILTNNLLFAAAKNKQTVGKTKEEVARDKKQELEKKLIDVSNQLGVPAVGPTGQPITAPTSGPATAAKKGKKGWFLVWNENESVFNDTFYFAEENSHADGVSSGAANAGASRLSASSSSSDSSDSSSSSSSSSSSDSSDSESG